MSLTLKPTSVKDACRVVARWHRHNRAPNGGLFAVSACHAGEIVGVAIAGRPIALGNCDGWTVEVTRCCTDGSRNCCSLLYGAISRAAKALGYHRVITYTLDTEPGTSLRAAGFRFDASVPPTTWNRAARHRYQTDLFGIDTRPPGAKVRWVRILSGEANDER